MATPNYTRSQGLGRATAAEIDAGLRAYMNKVYALMGGAMIITALVAYVVGMDFKALTNGQPTALIPESALVAMFSSPIRWVIMFAPLAVVFFFSFRIHKMSAETAQMVFWGFAALMGLSIAWIFAVFTGISIAQTFLATAAGFGAMSLYGYTTQKDLSGWGRFLFMGVIGLIVASLLNIFFFESSALSFAISLLGVLIFAGLTAYDTQNIKNTYLELRGTPEGEAVLEKGAVMGALSLYLNFLNMFMFLLQFMGMSEE
ncbi:MAG: Bax inhibitor-1/YccA family protein [Pseudomonadota bacterium]